VISAVAEPVHRQRPGQEVDNRMAWYRGLKTTYHLRALAATSTEKSTISTGKLNAVSTGGNDGLSAASAKAPDVKMSAGPAPVPKACRSTNRIVRRVSECI
jgi:ribonucleoside-diphosphate reductase alpha chain